MSKKYFSIEEANEYVPFLEKELLFLRDQKREISEKYHRLQIVKSHVDHIGFHEYADHEVFELECQLEFLHMEYTMHAKAIEMHGMQVKEVELGLVDFPAILDGVEVYLCWKLGEGSVSHYHGMEEGYLGRRKIS
ncbi:DUF2203 domain-containing protein [Brevibacterium sp. JNUCC-42]|nr:DUF2203 domain-containing protein [Brevibacterium sp. JNUCC-42]